MIHLLEKTHDTHSPKKANDMISLKRYMICIGLGWYKT